MIILLVSASPSITFEEPSTPANASTVTSSTQTIVANISDASNTSSWIDFDRSLVGYWSMDYFNETGVFDNSTYNNFGTFNGGLNYSNLTTGARGQGLTFDGDNDYLTMEDISNMAQQFTVSVWVKTIGNSTMGEGGIIHESYQWGSPYGGGFFIIQSFGDWVGGSGMYMHARIGNYSDAWDETSVNIDEGYPLDTWRFYTVVWDYPYLITYLNGNFFDNTTFPYTLNTTWNNLQIGSSFYNWDLNGSIDEVMIFNRTLSSTEILALYNSQENKFNATFTNLTEGQHNYTLYTINESGNTNNSGQRYFIYESPFINSCKNLSTSGQTYTLTSNVSSQGTCFNITAANITLNCNAYYINYSTDGAANTYGIYTNQFNTTINNCNIVDGNYSSLNSERQGIYFYGVNSGTINNNYVRTNNSQAIYLRNAAEFNNVTDNFVSSISNAGIDIHTSYNNTLINNFAISNSSFTAGITLYISSDNILINNTGTGETYGIMFAGSSSNNNLLINNTAISNSDNALWIVNSNNNTFISQTAISDGTNGVRRAINIDDSNNTLFRDCINISGIDTDVYIHYGDSYNNTFINCTYTSELVQTGNTELIRKWYYQAYTNYTNGTEVTGANITSYNSSNDIRFTTLTNSSGLIERQEVIEYVNTGGTRNYYNNYTINTTLSGYDTDTNTFNFTNIRNKIDDWFTLERETTSPTYNSASHNSTIAGEKVKFSINVLDNYALHPNGQYIFSTNNTGIWINNTANNFTATPSLIDTSKVLNSTIGKIIGYRWYFNDSNGNRNSTKIYTLTTEEEDEEDNSESSGGGGDEENPIFKPTYPRIQMGYEGYFRENDKIQINLSIKGIYLIEIKDINKIFGEIKFSLGLNNYSVKLNETIKINVDNDIYYDLEVSMISVTTTNSARLLFKEINERMSADEQQGVNLNNLGNESNTNILIDNLFGDWSR